MCNDLKISPSGDGDCNASALEKASIPLNLLPFYIELGSLAAISTSPSSLWTNDLRCAPTAFNRSKMITDYLLNSPDKEFVGESLRSYKGFVGEGLRSYKVYVVIKFT